MGWPALQENAFWNSGMFSTTPLTRNLRRRVRVGLHLQAQRFFARVLAPDLAERQEEALLGREAVDLGLALSPMVFSSAISAMRTPPLSAVFSPSVSLPLTWTPGATEKLAVLVGHAGGALLEFLGVLRRPPVLAGCRGRRTGGPGRRSRGSARGRSPCRCRRNSPRRPRSLSKNGGCRMPAGKLMLFICGS